MAPGVGSSGGLSERSHSGQYQVSGEVGGGFSRASALSLEGAWCPECPCETEWEGLVCFLGAGAGHPVSPDKEEAAENAAAAITGGASRAQRTLPLG